MIRDVLRLLKLSENSDSELINIAKGKYKIPMTFKEGLHKIRLWRLRKQ